MLPNCMARGLARSHRRLARRLETALAAVSEGRDAVIAESADLLFHLTVLWSHLDISPDEVMQALEGREGTSGLAEKLRAATDEQQS